MLQRVWAGLKKLGVSKASAMRVVRTVVITFLAIWVPLAVGWLQDVASWASGGGTDPFPAVSGLAYGAVAAASAVFVGLGNMIVIWIEDKTGKAIGRTPGT